MAANTGTADLEKIGKDFLTCSLCLGYYKYAKTLHCLHSFCEGCLVTLVEKRGKLVCPECRKPCDVPEEGVTKLGTNVVINGLVEFVKAREPPLKDSKSLGVPCDACESLTATSRCVDCTVNMCKTCCKCHSVLPPLRGHRLIAIDEYKATDPNPEHVAAYQPKQYCMVRGHEGNVLKLYCKSCQIAICLVCTVIDHRVPEHEHQYLTEKAEEFRVKFKDSPSKLETKAKYARDKVDETKQQLIFAKEAYDGEVAKVKKHTETLIEKAREHEEMLLTQLKEDYDSLTKYLDCEVDRYEIADKSMRSTANFVSVLMKYGDATEIAAKYQQTTARVDELLATSLFHDREISFPCFNPLTVDMHNTLGQLRTVQYQTKHTAFPRTICIGSRVTFTVTTQDENGTTAIPAHRVQAFDVTITSPSFTQQTVNVDNHPDGTLTVEMNAEEEGDHEIAMLLGGYQTKSFQFQVLSGPDLAKKLCNGIRVIRGRDWKWGDQDANQQGTIKRVVANGYVIVNWNHGRTQDFGMGNIHKTPVYQCGRFVQQKALQYRMGADECFDLNLDPN